MLGGGDASVMSPKDAPKVLSTASALASAWGCTKLLGAQSGVRHPMGHGLLPGWLQGGGAASRAGQKLTHWCWDTPFIQLPPW